MSCGTKLTPRFNSWFERDELANKLEEEGEYTLARKVKREECLSYSELNRAQYALERQGVNSFDLRKQRCACEEEQE